MTTTLIEDCFTGNGGSRPLGVTRGRYTNGLGENWAENTFAPETYAPVSCDWNPTKKNPYLPALIGTRENPLPACSQFASRNLASVVSDKACHYSQSADIAASDWFRRLEKKPTKYSMNGSGWYDIKSHLALPVSPADPSGLKYFNGKQELRGVPGSQDTFYSQYDITGREPRRETWAPMRLCPQGERKSESKEDSTRDRAERFSEYFQQRGISESEYESRIHAGVWIDSNEIRETDPNLWDDVVFLLNRISTLRFRPEHSEPRPPVSFQRLPEAKTLPRIKDETGEVIPIWHEPMHWRHIESVEPEPVERESSETCDAWEEFCFRKVTEAGYAPSKEHKKATKRQTSSGA